MSALVVALLTLQGGLTAEQAVAKALESSPRVKAYEERKKEALADGAVATGLKNPQFRLQSLRTDRLLAPALQGQPTGDAPLGGTMFALRWEPPNPMVNGARTREAEERGEEMGAMADAERRAVAAEVKTLHATVLLLDRQLELAKAAVVLRSKLAEVGQRRLAEKGARQMDSSLATLEELDARAAVLDLEHQRRESLGALAALLGHRGALELEGGVPTCQMPPVAAAALVEQALAQHPQVKAKRARAHAYEAERSQARRALIPWFDYLQLGYTLGNEGNPSYGSFRFGLTFPLLDWGGDEVNRAEARKGRADSETELEEREVVQAVERALGDLNDDAALVTRFKEVEAQVVAPSQQQLARALESGDVSLVEFASVQSKTLSARKAGLKTELHCLTSLYELERLTGPWAAPQAPSEVAK